MQLISVYLYQNKIDVFTNAATAWQTERYRRVYNRNLKIFRGVDNRIDIQVRNSDQKAADVSGSTLVFNLVERETQSLVAQKTCVTVSASTGKHYVELNESELLDIEAGFYQYSVYNEIRINNQDGTHTVTSRTPLYIDSQYDTLANIEVLDNGAGELLPSISSIIGARPQTTTAQSLHTFQVYCTNYSGQLIIQGSLDDDNDPANWVNLETITLSTETMIFKNVTGKYQWFRIKHTPNKAITNPGTVDKILYR